MATSNRRFVRVPADGNGKRIAARTVLYVDYSSATQEFFKGATVIGGTSSVRATVLDVIEATATTGQIVVNLEEQYFNSVFQVGENLIVDSQVYASAASAGDEVYYNEMVLVSGDNPTHRQVVNERGAQFTTFTDGSPRLDAFGRLKVSYPSVVGTYDLFYSSSLSRFSRITGAGGTQTYLPSQSCVLLSTDGTSGSLSRMTSNKYHTYLPGIGMSVMQTVILGDTGKSNNIRRWGLYDDTNGIYWELSGSTLNAVVRSSANGSVEETKIPQASWNRDKMDGSENPFTNLSRINHDITKNNIYTIDFQWLGAGRVNFGIVDQRGEAVLVHQIQNANQLSIPWMGESDLPIRYENVNTDATSGTSEMKMVCATVQADVPNYEEQLAKLNFGLTTPSYLITSSTENTHCIAARAAKYKEGKINRTLISVTSADVYTTQPTIIELVRNATLTDPSWQSSIQNSVVESDMSATSNTGGDIVYSTVASGFTHLDIESLFSGYEGEVLSAPGELTMDASTLSVRARLISGSSPSQLTLSFNWREYR